MGEFIAPWNLLQLALISVYPMYMSFFRIANGMSLLALYVDLLIVCVPVLFIQMKLGGYHQKGIVGLFSQHVPIAKGIGVALLIDLFLTCVYLAPLICHVGLYAMLSMVEKPYVWGTCSNDWNTNQCFDHETTTESVQTFIGRQNDARLPEQEFFDYSYLQEVPYISNITEFPVWHFSEAFQKVNFSLAPIALLVTWLLVFLFIAFGPRVCGWILFLLGPASLALLFAVMGYGYKNLDPNNTGKFLKQFYKLDFTGFVDPKANPSVIDDWIHGFNLLMFGLPVWTAIPVSIGKWVGKGRISRNVNWLVVIFVYACIVQVPQLAMAPYLGNLLETKNVAITETIFKGFKVVFHSMPAAFAILKVPPVYAMLFYLSMFISGVMFLCIAVMTIVDNIVDSLTTRYARFTDRRCCTTFVTSFLLILLLMGFGVLHMSKVGIYLVVLMDQSVVRLRFIIVILLAISLILVYVKQTFSIGERVIISIWCGLASISAAGLWIYNFQQTINQKVSYNNYYLTDVWVLISWIISAIPYIAIPAAVLHSCMSYDGSCNEKVHYLMCGSEEDDRQQDYDGYYPAPEPTAPPYTYMDNNEYLYPMNNLSKNYDSEMEPLNTNLRHTNM
ncbi:sodium- and chloride-dependent GABA transporter 2-like [Mytilus californianus]|uniref:sodium- and chloride-dependent GABA transporter 2-like n=1 Tax=Mytilus californianus TaxID=6549 RepID=UPI0022469378|nr:sodium- and chloride-dependent GABA transporter 2-like [Mytilus californianus]XP_052084061.1 sodium- and chloride-dependent GABA transporter 2-like [Mytilus californianus]